MEKKLFKVEFVSSDGLEYSYYIGAKDITEAVNKFKRIPDIDYIFDEDRDSFTISCMGVIY